uniref:uncharacterized protein LOC120333014 isoform X1 n=1 Tax=Styela clava TaxID=7725 RepID=UPI00193AB925|nr:uncharacterized protein LOC120333014 isoform X1 [Styela clava]XP_039256307.1 uncharacterized protein LOC120333026 isoform X1 [Styela clava]
MSFKIILALALISTMGCKRSDAWVSSLARLSGNVMKQVPKAMRYVEPVVNAVSTTQEHQHSGEHHVAEPQHDGEHHVVEPQHGGEQQHHHNLHIPYPSSGRRSNSYSTSRRRSSSYSTSRRRRSSYSTSRRRRIYSSSSRRRRRSGDNTVNEQELEDINELMNDIVEGYDDEIAQQVIAEDMKKEDYGDVDDDDAHDVDLLDKEEDESANFD